MKKYILKRDLPLAKIEEIKKPKSVWNLKERDKYYCVGTEGDVGSLYFLNSPLDKKRLEIGNIFLSKEEAEQELGKKRAIQRIKKYCWKNNIELADKKIINKHNISKYYIVYDTNNKEFRIQWTLSNHQSNLCFTKKDDIRKIIDKFEDDLKIIFNI